MSHWLKNCDEAHPDCQQYRLLNSELRYPKRLIQVGAVGDTHARVVETTERTVSERYLTLSYCWGDDSAGRLELTLETVHELEQGFPVQDLPRTIADAVEVTRRLGVPYLWVDALCILQDSKEDWHSQSAQMAGIYSLAYCNLAATHARQSGDGLFVERNPSHLEPSFVTVDSGGAGAEVYEVKELLLWMKRVDDAPLNRRGWVLQERLLARRTIHFGFDQVLWECFQTEACEQYPDAVRDWIWRRTLLQDLPDPEADVWPPKYPWQNVVLHYSRCQLTIASDKLVAIGGIAQKLRPRDKPDARYVAGFWTTDLPHHLMWKVAWFDTGRPKAYRAPSWSWAALDGNVSFVPWSGNSLVHVVEVVRVDVVTVNDDPFGQVLDARLWLRGRLFPCRLWTDYSGPGRPCRGSVPGMPDAEEKDFELDLDVYDWANKVNVELQGFLLPVWEGQYDENFTGVHYYYDSGGLILQSAESPGEYRRVGHYKRRSLDKRKGTYEAEAEQTEQICLV